jgi:hypothetical protein
VVVFAEGETVGGVVVAAFGKGNQVCGCVQARQHQREERIDECRFLIFDF